MRLVGVVILAACHGTHQLPPADTSPINDVAIDAFVVGCTTGCGSGQQCVFHGCGAAMPYSCVDPVTTDACTAMGDSDGDGLLDEWEAAGYIDLNCNGVNDGDGVDIQLPDAHVDAADVYLELDYMQQAGTGAACSTDAECQAAVPGEQCVANVCTHTHQPKMTSLVAVQTAAQRGLPNDTSRPGFYIHYDLAHMDAIAESAVVAFDVSNPACVGPDAADFFAIKRAHFYTGPDGPTSTFAIERTLFYHYAVFAHHASCPPDATGGQTYCNMCLDPRGLGSPTAGMTGTAETPGNDLIVSLGGLYFGLPTTPPRARSDINEGGTLMHELGHNLGLGHGVTQSGPHEPSPSGPLWSPIYFSVMNYNYQTRGVLLAASPGGGTPALGKLDYSDLDGCADLDESALDENVGAACAASTNYVVSYFADVGGAARFASAQTGTAIDWNGDGMLSVASDDLNRNSNDNSTDIFRSLNDWAYDASTHHFTTLQLDTTCRPWTLQDGVAPAAAISAHELSPGMAHPAR